MRKANRERLLEILVRTRTVKALDEVVSKNRDYQSTLRRQDEAFDLLDQMELSKEQKTIVDKIISAANECGAACGAIAYRLGLHDGIKLTAEIRELT